MILADGTYEFTLTPRCGAGIDIKATVQAGQVTAWERNTLPALPAELERIPFTELLAVEVAKRARLGDLLRPVVFTPTAREVAA